MDVTFTTKFDAKRYARAVRRALAFSFRGLTIFSWCIMAAWLVSMFDWWIRGCPEVQGCTSLWSLPFFCGCVEIFRRVCVRIYVRHMQQMLGVVGIRQSALPEMRTTSCNAILQYV